jgi:amino acid adenylation domain-containing protein
MRNGPDPMAGLTEKQRELLRLRLAKLPPRSGEVAPPLRRRTPERADYPLSFAQQRLWFLHQWDPKSPAYNAPAYLRLDGPIDEPALAWALAQLVNRHAVLRTRFLNRDGEARQVIDPAERFVLGRKDLRLLAAAERQGELLRLAAEELNRPFDLSAEPGFRAVLAPLEPQSCALLLTTHHIVSDGWSVGLVLRDLGELYEAKRAGRPPRLPELPIQYADFAAWQQETVGAVALEQQLAYWKPRLAGPLPVLELPWDRPRPAEPTYRGALFSFMLPADLGAAVGRLCQSEEATPFMVLLAVFKTLLFRYSGQTDLLVGTPVSGRTRREVEDLVGVFVNLLVLRTAPAGALSFRDYLRQVRTSVLGALAHQEIPFERLVEELRPERDPSHTPFFQVVFSFQNTPRDHDPFPGLRLRPVEGITDTIKFDLELRVSAVANSFACGLGYRRDWFDHATIARLAQHFEAVLRGAVTSPETRLAELSWLSEEEQRQLREWGGGESEWPVTEGLVLDWVQAAVRERPEALAVRAGGVELSYIELNARANRLAHYLSAQGAGPGERVGICLDRSLELVVSWLAVLKTGAAYVALDPTHPAERLGWMIADAQPRLVLAGQRRDVETRGHRDGDSPVRWVAWEEAWEEAQQRPDADPAVTLHGEDLAYLIYTSGSTGRPKGVAIHHRGLAGLVRWHRQRYNVQPSDRATQLAAPGFDASVWEVWPYLATGASLHLPEDDVRTAPERLRAWLAEEQITITFLPTPLAEAVLALAWPYPTAMRVLLTGGDRLRRWAPTGLGFSVVNHYGPTECTVVATCGVVGEQAGGLPPIGRPIGDTEALVLDRWGRLVPAGVVGELYLGGARLAQHYWRCPELTAERFVPHPRRPGARLYRTGDLVRWRGAGELEFVGRDDGQVKVRGYRIELGEIEAVLGAHPGVETCTVTASEEAGQTRLVGYVVKRGEAALEVESLRAHLRRQLPDHMVPAAWVWLERLPLTSQGKVDRAALPAPGEGASGAPEAPSGVLEELLAGIWERVLEVERVGARDDFFALGGHSLLATRIMAQVRAALKIEMPLRVLFEAPTLRAFAERVQAARRDPEATPPPPVQRVERGGRLPLSYAQQRLWFVAQLPAASEAYHIAGVLRLRGDLNREALERSFHEIAQRHETLRSTFPTLEGEPVQRVAAALTLRLDVDDLSEFAEAEREGRARDLAQATAQERFDLALGPLFRVRLVRLGEREHWLVIVLHHIVADGWSMGVLGRELARLYPAFRTGQPSPLVPLELQYVDYAVWQRRWLSGGELDKQLSYWRKQLRGAPASVELPADTAAPQVPTYRGDRVELRLEREVMQGLERVGRKAGTTLFMTVLGAFALLLHRYSGQREIVVGTPVANRQRPEVEGLIGLFVNAVALRVEVDGAVTFRQWLPHVRDVVLEAYEHQDLPFERVVEELAPARELNRHPIFQVMLSVLRVEHEVAGWGDLELSSVPLRNATAKFDWLLTVTDTPTGGVMSLEYRSDRFGAETIRRALQYLGFLLRAVAQDADRPVSELPLIGEADVQCLLESGRVPAASDAESACVHALVARQAARTPESIAVSHGTVTVTYRELNRRADEWAVHLRSLGVGPEVLVAVYAERSIELVVGLLAILKAGGAYVPMDLAYPPERLDFMLEDCHARVLLTQRGLRTNLAAPALHVVYLDEAPPTATSSVLDSASSASPDQLAYVVYTSGSTGQPKGVAVPHGAVVRLVSRANYLQLTPEDVVAQASSVSFDAATFELWGALINGARLVILSRETLLSPRQFADALREFRVSTLFLTTALFNQLAQECPTAFAGLRHLLFGGEKVDSRWVRAVLRAGRPRRLLHVYGPTECTTYATWQLVDSVEDHALTIPIGRPLTDTASFILDQGMRPAPVGVPGELYLGGGRLARGYLRRAELTAERWVPDPFSADPGARLYRTGDWCRYREDGAIEFLGRVDQQVKLRGFRIELSEIEAALAQHPAVRDSVVVLREEVPGEKQLVAYVSLQSGVSAEVGTLQRHLTGKLPAYMVPGALVLLEQLPLTANGKVDRQALPAPRAEINLASGQGPVTELERAVAQVWQEVLGRPAVGRQENFFEAGGHSLLLVRVQRQLRDRLGCEIGMVELFQHPTIETLARHLRPGQPNVLARADAAPSEPHPRGVAWSESIAIVGMAGRFPGAQDLNQFWSNLCRGVESITRFSDAELLAAGVDARWLNDPAYVKAGGVVDEADRFDAAFFGFTAREAAVLDPQHRLFLEAAWAGLEDAACDPGTYPGRIGVFGGCGPNTYGLQVRADPEAMAGAGGFQVYLSNDEDFLATRVSYKLDLTGPSLTLQTACSTSLVAVQVACQSLLGHQCDLALAGGVHLRVPQKRGYWFQEGMILSPDGHCRAFDAQAAGTLAGEGVGVVVLKRLSEALRDGDPIRAVIRGAAVNNDGRQKVGYTAPQVRGQAEVIAEAQRCGGVKPDTIGYVEAHGTGTPLGDPIEVAALTQAFRTRTDRRQFCVLGSVKTNLGHLDAAAGVAGLIKTVLVLAHGQIPPTLHLQEANPKIDWAASPFRVSGSRENWPLREGPRRAGVSSFGMGGTNAHVVLEEAPERAPSGAARLDHLLVLSAKTPAALETATARLADYLRNHPEQNLADVAWTLQVGRPAFECRRALVCRDSVTALARLDGGEGVMTSTDAPRRRPVVFLFPGQGAQVVNMGRDLYEQETLFRQVLDECCERLQPALGRDLRAALYPLEASPDPASPLNQTALTQPALFAVEYALARLWESWGIRAEAMLGHSIGDYVAATLAGVFSLGDALELVAARGRLMQEQPAGAMLSVLLPEGDLAAILVHRPEVSLAAVNGPRACVLSGPATAIAACEQELAARGVPARLLRTSHAFHSAMMDQVMGAFTDLVKAKVRREPQRPMISSMTGRWLRPDEAIDPHYWGQQLRQPVRFSAGMQELLQDPERLFLEVGPGQTLTTLARQHTAAGAPPACIASLPRAQDAQPESTHLVNALGHLWLHGAAPDWPAFNAPHRRLRLHLPPYPFQRHRCWVEPDARATARRLEAVSRRADLADWFYLAGWKSCLASLHSETVTEDRERGCWLMLVDDTGVGEAVAQSLETQGRDVWRVRPGNTYGQCGDRCFEIVPGDSTHYVTLLEALKHRAVRPAQIVHLWSLTAEPVDLSDDRTDALIQERGFYSLLFLAQALGQDPADAPVTLTVVTNGLHAIEDGDRVVPQKATLLGPCRVIPKEYPNVACRCLELNHTAVQPAQLDRTAGQLMDELGRRDPSPLVACRGRQRWMPAYERRVPQPGASPSLRLREQGTCLITGGLGGIGLELAFALAKSAQARLALVSRSPFPGREAWEEWIQTHEESDAVSVRIRRLQAIESAGGQVWITQADVGDPHQVHSLLTATEQRFGPIHAVIHAAGIAGGGLIQLKSRPAAERVLSAKLDGTLALARQLAGRPLDFFVLCSSLTGTLGAVGQVDYCAANAFLDAFAEACHGQGGPPTVALAWDTWREVGMAVHTDPPAMLRAPREERLRHGLSSKEGREVFARALADPAPRLLVSTFDFEARLEASLKARPSAPGPNRDPVRTAAIAPPRDRAALETLIAKVWQQILGVEQVRRDDNFFALGADSLAAVQAAARLREESGLLVKVVTIYDAPTPGSLAARLQPQGDAGEELTASEARAAQRLARGRHRRRTRSEA